MEFNDEHRKYFAYITDKVLPALKEKGIKAIETPTVNIEWNLKKLLGQVKGMEIDVQTYVNRTKSDFRTIVEALKPGDPVREFGEDVLEKIDGFFGLKPPEPVDMKPILTAKAKAIKEKLNWKKSVVDLCKVLGLKSDLKSRRKHAVALGFPEDKLAEMPNVQFNTWLHGQLMSAMAHNHGEVPKDLLV
jgi:hypothetical protein